MKKLLLCVVIVLSIGNQVNCQTNVYHPFPDSAMWRVDYYKYNLFQIPTIYRVFFHYSVIGDTIINTKEYKKIYRSYFDMHVTAWYPSYPIPESEPARYFGALRDDSVDNKVYFVFPGANADSLLFDYNINIGDTLRGIPSQYYGYEYNPIKVTLTSIDSIMIEGEYRKRWNFDTCSTAPGTYTPSYFIEGIGSNFGLFESFNTYAIDFIFSYLVCVKNGSATLFESGYNSEMGCQPIIESLPELDNELELLAFPNPFSQTTTIQSDVVLKDATLTIYDAVGNQVRIMKNISGQTILLERDNLPCGMYFCQLTQDKFVIATKKLMVSDK